MSTAIDFVDLCIQHAAYITGRKTIEEEIETVYSLMQGMYDYMLITFSTANI